MRRWLLAVVTTALGVTLVGFPAAATAPDAHGWWWFAQPAGSPVTVPPPPYVPEDGLYVASNPTGAEAVSALRFRLAEANDAGTLTLRVAGEARGTPVLGLCVVTEHDWEPAQGGALADAPPFECAAGAAAGVVAEDGTTVTFPTAALVTDDVLDVALVPGEDSSGGNPTFQVAFEPPGEEALAAAPSGGGGSTVGTDAPMPPAATPSSATPAPAPTPSPTFTAVSPSAPQGPEAEVRPPTTGNAGTGSDGPTAATTVAGSTDGRSGDTNRTRLLGFVVLAGAALTYHRLSTTTDRAPEALVRFGTLSTDAEQSTPSVGAIT